jgi:hypothetical protein
MSLQIHSRSEELRASKVAGLPYERNARANAQTKSDVDLKAMSEPVLCREQPSVKKSSHFI